MRLIDADAINPMRCPRSIAPMRAWLDEQPTAYDIDKVVEKIGRKSMDNTDGRLASHPKLMGSYISKSAASMLYARR